MAEAASPPVRAAERARLAVLVLLLALFAAATLAVTREDVGAAGRIVLAAFLLAPLAAPLPGLLRRRRRAYAWASLCLTPHFIYALTELVANPALRALAASMLVLALALMIALVAYLRLTREGVRG